MNDPLYVPERSMEPPETGFMPCDELYLRNRRRELEQKRKDYCEEHNKFCAWLAKVPAVGFISENTFLKFRSEEVDYYNDQLSAIDDELFQLACQLEGFE